MGKDTTSGATAALYARVRDGERRALGRLLSVVERGGSEADDVTERAHRDMGHASIVGITGAPGAGKSTLTGALVTQLLEQGRKPAVLAVDPSSPLTGGAILGDRIRMDERVHSAGFATPTTEPFIRSMATRGHAGGLALAVPAGLRLFDAAGYDPIIVETVGIGQVEVDVAAITDTTVVVVNPGWGDSVQANKSGLLEVADVLVINKADRPGADQARRDLELMLDLGHISGLEDRSGYRPPIVMCVATSGDAGSGVADVWNAVEAHRKHLVDTATLTARRAARRAAEIRNRVEHLLLDEVARAMAQADVVVSNDDLPPNQAAAQVYDSIIHPELEDTR